MRATCAVLSDPDTCAGRTSAPPEVCQQIHLSTLDQGQRHRSTNYRHQFPPRGYQSSFSISLGAVEVTIANPFRLGNCVMLYLSGCGGCCRGRDPIFIMPVGLAPIPCSFRLKSDCLVLSFFVCSVSFAVIFFSNSITRFFRSRIASFFT